LPIINISPLIDSNGGASGTGATGTLTATVMVGGVRETRIDGAEVTIPAPVEVSFKDGVLDAPLELDLLATGFYWRLTLFADAFVQTFYFTIPEDEETDFSDLTFVNPRTYTAFTNVGPVEQSFEVEGGTDGTQPTFSGAPMFTGSYYQNGDLVFFRINVEMDNITSFGTGQYYLTLPIASKYSILMRDGCLHDASNGNQWSISGHIAAGSDILNLWYTSGTGQDEVFDHNSPSSLATADSFHVSGTYIKE